MIGSTHTTIIPQSEVQENQTSSCSNSGIGINYFKNQEINKLNHKQLLKLSKMKKFLTTAICTLFVFAGTSVFGQGPQVGVNLRSGVPVGDFADYAGFGIGGGVNFNYLVSENFSVGIEAGYMSFLENELSPEITGSSTVIPIIANARYIIGTGDLRPFIGLGLGYTAVNQTVEIDLSAFSGEVEEFDESYGGFTIAPHVGLMYNVVENVNIYLAADYSTILNEAEGVEVVEDDNAVTGGAEAVVLDPYSYVGINLGVSFYVGSY